MSPQCQLLTGCCEMELLKSPQRFDVAIRGTFQPYVFELLSRVPSFYSRKITYASNHNHVSTTTEQAVHRSRFCEHSNGFWSFGAALDHYVFQYFRVARPALRRQLRCILCVLFVLPIAGFGVHALLRKARWPSLRTRYIRMFVRIFSL